MCGRRRIDGYEAARGAGHVHAFKRVSSVCKPLAQMIDPHPAAGDRRERIPYAVHLFRQKDEVSGPGLGGVRLPGRRRG